MRILEVTPSVSRLGGGLFESVRHLAKTIHCGREGQILVLALEDQKTADDIGQWAPLPVKTYKVIGPTAFGFSPGLLRDLLHSQADLVHLHGLWKFTSIAVHLWARRTGKPHIVSPHGMLEPWAFQQRRMKKLAALSLFQGRCLEGAACLRATSALEAESIGRAGLTKPVVVVPNGVHILGNQAPNPPRKPGQKRQALFLSRLHPKKGLLNLIEAWARVRPAGWELAIAGPDEAGHLAKVKAKARACAIEHEVRFIGEVLGATKLQLYHQSNLFILPSFSENFGLVAAEALSCGVPVITTKATPWSELEQHQCGWWIELGIEPLTGALRQATRLPSSVLRQMGARGRQLIRERYDWNRIAGQMLEVYRSAMARGRKSIKHPSHPAPLEQDTITPPPGTAQPVWAARLPPA